MATIRAASREVWEVRVFGGRDDHSRPIQVSRSVHGGNKDAEKVARAIGAQGGSVKGARRTVADLLDAWQAHKEQTWAVYTRRDQATRASPSMPTRWR